MTQSAEGLPNTQEFWVGAGGGGACFSSPSTWKAEAGESLSWRPAWSTEFQDSQGYRERPVLEINTFKDTALQTKRV